MSVYMDDIAVAGGIAEIRKGIRNYAKMEKEKKISYGLKNTKYMMVKARKKGKEVVEKKVKSGTVRKTETYYLLRNNNKQRRKPRRTYKGDSKKSEIVSRETDGIRAKSQFGK